jgi:hypothetical protein
MVSIHRAVVPFTLPRKYAMTPTTQLLQYGLDDDSHARHVVGY